MKNIADLVTDEVKNRVNLVKDELAKRYKRVEPYRKELIDKETVYKAYQAINTNNFNDYMFIQDMIQKYGKDTMNDFLYDMYKVETDGRRKINAYNAIGTQTTTDIIQ